MSYAYRITVQRLSNAPRDAGASELTFDTTNHDEIISLIERVKAGKIVSDEEAAAFTIGLKLFGEVMLRHRVEPLFADLFPHFGAFMKRLKGAAVQAAGA